MANKETSSKSPGPVSQEDMGRLLEIINPPDASLYYFGIRHHSPVASHFLLEAFKKVEPDIVLIEGPADADELIPDIMHQNSKPPFAIHSYFSDDKNKLGYNGELTPKEDIPLRVSAWFPFTDYSPEYIAIQEATRRGKEVHFIDIPLEQRLKHEVEIANEKAFFNKYGSWSDRCMVENAFMKQLVQHSRFRSFNEFWNHHYEVNALALDLDEYMSRLLAFTYELRWLPDQEDDYPAWKTIIEREKYMANQIAACQDGHPDAKILVITGAFHTVALPFIKKKGRVPRLPKKITCTLSPYSYARISENMGYKAGVESPFYQHLLWRHITGQDTASRTTGGELPFNDVALELLLRIRKKITKTTSSLVSTADAINALHMARNLASLRGRDQVSHEDLIDAIISSYVKGQVDIYGADVMKIAREYFIGHRVGWAHNSGGNPLKDDFYKQAKANRIKITDKDKNLRVEIYKRESHREKSHFLHRTVFMNLGFARMSKGPNFITKEHLELLVEKWTVRWTPRMDEQFSSLIQYGSTIEEACRNMLVEKIGEAYQSVDDMLVFLTMALQMGFLELFKDLILDLTRRSTGNQNFLETINTLSTGVMLYKYRSSLIPQHNRLVKNFVFTAYTSAVTHLKDLIQVPEDQVQEAVHACRVLSQVTVNSGIDMIDATLIVDTLDSLFSSGRDIIAPVDGAFTGILYSFNAITEDDIINRFKARVFSNQDIQAASDFLLGLFLLNKTVLVTSDKFLETIHESIVSISDDRFLELLPSLRRCFTVFIPREIDYIATKLARMVGIVPELDLGDLDPEALVVLQELDQDVDETLVENWGL